MRNYFCGWYIKCQSDTQTIALIPARHITGNVKTGSLQVITEEGTWNLIVPMEQYTQDKGSVRIGSCEFTREGCRLDVREAGLTLRGELTYGEFSPIAYDIMGPFRYIPFLECRHSVFSMGHRVDGHICLNGREFVFADGVCYMEGDRGRSFPKEYLWTQCCFPEGSILLSVADIPFCGIHFTGIISVIRYRGREYRLATYLGARAAQIREGGAVIRQGSKTLTVRRLEGAG